MWKLSEKEDTLTGLLLLDSQDRTVHATARRRVAYVVVALLYSQP